MMTLLKKAPLAALLVMLTAAVMASPARADLRPDGIHTEPWFLNQSFMLLKEDLDEAVADGKKGLVLIWEQEGCGSCERTHEVNFAKKSLVDYISKNFAVMSMNMYGEVMVTDFDGEKMPEKNLAQKMRVNFSPTTVFFNEKGEEVFRIPGYFKPFYYLAGFVYVAEKGYDDPDHRGMFPRWLKAHREQVQAIYGGPPGD